MLTVITPVRNARDHIEQALRCVAEQCVPGQIEHLVIDGASTDGTVDTIRQFALQHDHVRWVSEPDSGQSHAMNKGIHQARGTILGFLNADDYYEPHTLSKALRRFEGLPEPSFVVANCNVWKEDGQCEYVSRPLDLNVMRLLELRGIPVNPSAYFYHKSLHARVGQYAVDEHQLMDYDFLIRAVQHAQVHHVDETWGNFRLVPGTKTFQAIAEGILTDELVRMRESHLARLPLIRRVEFRVRGWCRQLRQRIKGTANQRRAA